MSPSLICANPEIRELVRSFDAIVGAFVYGLAFDAMGQVLLDTLQDGNTINRYGSARATLPQRVSDQLTVKFTGVDLT
jgi:hypothetical protein